MLIFAKKNIDKGTMVIEYIGQKITKEGDKRQKAEEISEFEKRDQYTFLN